MFDSHSPALAGDPMPAGRRRRARDRLPEGAAAATRLAYQPRLDLRSAAHLGNDASLRWAPRRRAEDAADDGAWLLAAACLHASAWRGAAMLSVPLGQDPGVARALPGRLAQALAGSGLAPERLELAVGEAAMLAEDLDLLLALSAIRDLGVGLLLTDFGRCHASLSMLRRLPFTAVKLDRALVRGLPDDPEDAAVLRAVLGAAHAMGLAVTADGIETEAQRAFLSACGCDAGMGPLLCGPLPPERLRALGYG